MPELDSDLLAKAYVYGHPDAAQIIHVCPHCQSATLTDGVVLADRHTVSFCFSCTATSD
jgi:hypothetical protein